MTELSPNTSKMFRERLRVPMTQYVLILRWCRRKGRMHMMGNVIGDRVWLFNPAIKTGHTKKLSSLWRRPYTVNDRLSSVNYKIQLTGTTTQLFIEIG